MLEYDVFLWTRTSPALVWFYVAIASGEVQGGPVNALFLVEPLPLFGALPYGDVTR